MKGLKAKRGMLHLLLAVVVLIVFLALLLFGNSSAPIKTNVSVVKPTASDSVNVNVPDEASIIDDVSSSEIIRNYQEGLLLRTEVGQIGSDFQLKSRETPISNIPEDGLITVKNKAGKLNLFSEAGPWYLKKGITEHKSKAIGFNLDEATRDQLKSGLLTFSVVNTNFYGPLIISLNNQIIWDKLTRPGTYKIDLLNYNSILVTGENKLHFDLAGSGWRIWAPNSYILTNININSEHGQNLRHTVKSTLRPNEIRGWVKGRLLFEVQKADNAGDLSIVMNNFTIFTGKVPEQINPKYQIDFSLPTKFLKDNNDVTFFTSDNGFYTLGDLSLIVFYSPDVVQMRMYDFMLDQETYFAVKNKTKAVRVYLNIDEIKKDGYLNLYIMNKFGSRTLYNNKIQKDGTIELEVPPILLIDGKNNIQLTSNGTYGLGMVELRIEDKKVDGEENE